MKTMKWFPVMLVLASLIGCAATTPTNHGVNLFNVDIEASSSNQANAQEFKGGTLVRVSTNPASSRYEPYPRQTAYIYKPAEEPARVIIARQNLINTEKELRSLSSSDTKFAETQKKFSQAANRYEDVFFGWVNSKDSKLELKTASGDYYGAVGIEFKNSKGEIVDAVSNGEIKIKNPTELKQLEPYYGGEKVVFIPKPLSEMISEGWRMVIMTNDDSRAKRVFDLDGKGLNGEKHGTLYSDFNPLLQGVKFTDNNPRIKAIPAGSSEAKLFVQEQKELFLKAAIVAYKQDAAEFCLLPELEEFKGFALNPFTKRWIERKSSRLEAIRQEAGRWDIAPIMVTNFSDFGVGVLIMKSINMSTALFGNRQVYYFGSAGSNVLAADFAIAQLENEQRLTLSSGARERNEIISRINDIYDEMYTLNPDSDEYKALDKKSRELRLQHKEMRRTSM